jgi:hypothetical protein
LKGEAPVCGARHGWRILGIPAPHAPDPDCFELGIDAFRERLGSRGIDDGSVEELLRAGARRWREWLVAQEGKADAEPAEPEPEAEDEDEDEDRGWDPERVADALDRLVAHGAHLLRRARWFCRLSDSCLLWAPKGGPAFRRMLVLERGRVAIARELGDGEEPQLPSTRRSQRARQCSFDGATYDRLRVLTTELRRLVAQGRKVELILGPQTHLDCPALAKLLRWV